jgi:adenylyltransferase/sulfurtransferase
MTALTDELLDAIAQHVEPHYPNEACGLVLEGEDGGLKVVPTPNLADKYHALDPEAYPRTSRTFYMINTLEIAKAQRRGEKLRVIFHSHCDVGDYFSEEDHRQAVDPEGQPLWPGCQYLVVSVREGRTDHATLFAHTSGAGAFEEVEAFSFQPAPSLQSSTS